MTEETPLFEHVDTEDSAFRIWRSRTKGGAALVTSDLTGIPPHKIPPAARALYEAAGLPVPDLPDIPDPALVGELAKDIAMYFDSQLTYEANASRLLAAGWRRL